MSTDDARDREFVRRKPLVKFARSKNTPTSPMIPGRSPSVFQEFVRRRRLERLASNLSNNSDSSGNGGAQNRLSFPEAPPPSLIPASLQENATPTPPLMIPGRSLPFCPFDLDDMVMVERRDAAPWCGVVRWIGELPEILGQPVAGIEMVCAAYLNSSN